MKVLIAGAGPTGLTTGIELARRGIQAEVVERRDEVSTESRAIGINPRSLEILTPSGVTKRLLAEGVKFKRVHFYRGSEPWATIPLTAAPMRYGHNYMLGLPQDRTEAILRDVFVGLGGVISYGRELTGVRQDSKQVIAETADGVDISCDYLVGADGTRSTVREAVGIECDQRELPGDWSTADVESEGWRHPEAATLCLLPGGGTVVVIPLGGDRLRVLSNRPDALAALPLELEISSVRREGLFRILIFQVEEYSRGRVFLAGDSAHSHSPTGGRGMNLGIADAADLAARFAEGGLDGYTQARLAGSRRIIAGAEQMRRLLSAPGLVQRSFVLCGIKTVAALPALERAFATRFLYD